MAKNISKRKTQVQETQDQEMMVDDDFIIVDDDFISEYSGSGLDEVNPRDLILPRFTIIQKLSPQLEKDSESYNPELSEGAIYDVSTGRKLDDEIKFCIIKYRKRWLEWAPRETQRGLVEIHEKETICEGLPRNERGQPMTQDGNIIVETAQFYGLNFNDKTPQVSLISMSSTQLRKARKWLTLMTSERVQSKDGKFSQAPSWWRLYKLGTIREQNAQGSWYGWSVERAETLKKFCIGNEIDFIEMAKTIGLLQGQISDSDYARAENASQSPALNAENTEVM